MSCITSLSSLYYKLSLPKGPCVLVLQKNKESEPLHVVWGIPKGHTSPAVMVATYRPSPELWKTIF